MVMNIAPSTDFEPGFRPKNRTWAKQLKGISEASKKLNTIGPVYFMEANLINVAKENKIPIINNEIQTFSG